MTNGREVIETRQGLGRAEKLLAVVAFLTALAVRIVPFADDVFQPGGIVPWRCPDVYYHLHRIEIAAKNWPRIPEFDMWRNYPDGAYSIWTPLFDLVPAAFAAWTSAPPLIVGSVWPALLGALAVFPLLDLLRRLHGQVAWLGVALFVVLPGSVSFAFLGRTDHHVGEVLMQLCVYALTLRGLHDLQQSHSPRARDAVWLGVVMGLSLWMWRGSVVILAAPAGTALLMIATSRDAELRRAATRFFTIAFAVAALVTLPYGALNVVRGRAPFAPYFLSLLQPAILICWTLSMPLARQIGETGWRIGPLLRGRNALALLAAIAILTIAVDGLRAGTAFLTRVGDAWAATIVESMPLWSGGLPTFFAIEQVGFVPLLLAAVLPVHFVLLLRSRPPSPSAVFVLLVALVATALAFMQVRFVYYAAPVVAALPGALWHAFRGRRPVQVAALGLALGLLWPVTRFWSPVIDGDPHTQMRPAQMEPWLTQLLADLYLSTPSAGDVRRPDVRPEYCVLAPWDLGNFIQTMAERPVLASSGGPHETDAYRDTVLFAHHFTQESEAVQVMTRRGCRYAITEYVDPRFEPKGASATLFARRLHFGSGSDRNSHDGSGRFRWRFESHDPANPHGARYRCSNSCRARCCGSRRRGRRTCKPRSSARSGRLRTDADCMPPRVASRRASATPASTTSWTPAAQ